MPEGQISFHIELDVELSVDEVWPDGDAPDKITVEEVVKTFDRAGVRKILRDWELDLYLDEMDITTIDIDPAGNREVGYGTYRDGEGLVTRHSSTDVD